MTRRELFKMAVASPALAVLPAIELLLGKPEPLEEFKPGEALMLEQMNKLVRRVNQLT